MYRRKFIKISMLVVLSIFLILSFVVSAPAKEKIKATPPGMINSVLGPISPDKLGQTLMHEHFVFGYPGWSADLTMAPENPKAILKTDLAAIRTAKKFGIKTIVDATPNDAGGRDPKLYKALAKKTGINIICSTGLYTEHEGSPAYWNSKAIWGMDISKMMSELFIKEITEGIGKTRVKAGVIKVGSGPKMSKYEEAIHKAAVVAQKATGVPIITHTEGPTGGVEQAEFLLKEGADPKKLMIGHVSNSKDIEYHKAILAKGVYIAFDRIGLDIITPFDVNLKNVAELCQAGYADKIMLSHDTVNVWLGRPTVLPEKFIPAFKNWHIAHVSNDFIPALKAQGVTDEQIKTMMVDNPRKLFLGE
jgi:phosphotriesterase-related protein